jgi:amidase
MRASIDHRTDQSEAYSGGRMSERQNKLLNRRSATELANLIRTKAVSPVEILQAHLEAISKLNPSINAICTLAAEQALEAAKKAEAAVMSGESLGPLHGLPVGIKDVTPTAGIRTTYGSSLFADHIPEEDAAVVTRLRQAGAIILCKTNTPEFATGANTVNKVFGATRNPWDLALTVGGSTGGGAAAVASGMLPLAEGTDFGGSLRVPAAFCGVVGLRPTAGLIPSYPVPLPWHPGRTHGPIARNAEDVALLLDAMSGLSDVSPISVAPPWHDLVASVRSARDAVGLKIAYAPDIAGVGVDEEISEICRAAALQLSDAGARTEEIEFDLSAGCDAYRTLRGEWMVGQYFRHLDDLEKFGPNLAGNIKVGISLTAKEIAAAETMRALLWHKWRTLFEKFDFLLTPTVPVSPFPIEQNYPETVGGRKMQTYIDWIAPTFLVTLCSLPASSVPCGATHTGLPVGIQIVSRRFDEMRNLSLAKVIEEMHPLGWPAMVNADG